jgi:hypothetical protein
MWRRLIWLREIMLGEEENSAIGSNLGGQKMAKEMISIWRQQKAYRRKPAK